MSLSTDDVLAALGAANGQARPMSRQNFHQSGLAKAIPVARRIGHVRLHDPAVVGLWARWLLSRRAWIALGLLPGDAPLVPPGGEPPWWVKTGEYEWACPECGGLAIGGPAPDDHRLWCPVDGVVGLPPDSGGEGG